jgi:hypothetical protein
MSFRNGANGATLMGATFTIKLFMGATFTITQFKGARHSLMILWSPPSSGMAWVPLITTSQLKHGCH